MSDARISELTELVPNDIDGADLAPVVDVSDTTDAPSGTTKKTTFAAILAFIQASLTFVPPYIHWVDLSGTVDGSNAVFTLAVKPDNGVIHVSMARQDQYETDDYTYDGDITVTFNAPPDASLATEPLKALVY